MEDDFGKENKNSNRRKGSGCWDGTDMRFYFNRFF